MIGMDIGKSRETPRRYRKILGIDNPRTPLSNLDFCYVGRGFRSIACLEEVLGMLLGNGWEVLSAMSGSRQDVSGQIKTCETYSMC